MEKGRGERKLKMYILVGDVAESFYSQILFFSFDYIYSKG